MKKNIIGLMKKNNSNEIIKENSNENIEENICKKKKLFQEIFSKFKK